MPSLPRPLPPSRAPPTPSSTAADLSAPIAQTLRSRKAGVYAVGVAVIAAAGALFGAGLRTAEQDKARQAEPQESNTNTVKSVDVPVVNVQGQIDLLEGRRGQLTLRKEGLERKLGELRQRMEKKKEREAEAERTGANITR